jgi:A/G-specific adenine glycosylase
VAEVMLQQTRVAQAIPFYRRFLRRFPTLAALARADEEAVLRAWAGAGYYARARRLREAAQVIVARHGGELPATAAELRTLPGVGPYIAAAVASLAFDEAVPALEANGRRVIARWGRVDGDLARPSMQRRLESELAAHLAPVGSGEFQEALMELGETICTPRAPRCGECPVARECRARLELADPASIPPARTRRPVPHVRASIAALRGGGRLYLQRRTEGGLLRGLWELPGGRPKARESDEAACRREVREETGLVVGALLRRGEVHHRYSHLEVTLTVFEGRVPGASPGPTGPDAGWFTPAQVRRLAKPRATEKALALLERPTEGTVSRGSGSRPGRTAA